MSDPIWDEWKQGREMLEQMAIPTPPASDPLLARLEEMLAEAEASRDRLLSEWQDGIASVLNDYKARGLACDDAAALRRVIALITRADTDPLKDSVLDESERNR